MMKVILTIIIYDSIWYSSESQLNLHFFFNVLIFEKAFNIKNFSKDLINKNKKYIN